MDKKVCIIRSYNPAAQKLMGQMDSGKKDPLQDRLIAGDYSDSITRFRLVILPPDKDFEGLAAYRTYSFFVSPYKSDTVFVGYPSISYTVLGYSTTIVGAGKRKFKVTLLPGNKAVEIVDVSNQELTPYLRLFENKLPNIKFPLLTGEQRSLTSFEHEHKLIYLFFLGSPYYTPYLNNLDTLKEVYTAYKKDVTIIGFTFLGDPSKNIDTLEVNKVSADRKLNWVQGFCDLELCAELFINNSPDGMLFDEDGNLLKMYILPGELKVFLKKKYGK